MIRRLLTNPTYPRTLQYLMSLMLAVILGFLIWGPHIEEYNPGSYILWYLWWSSLPLVVLFLGRFWCGMCPVGFFTDLAQKIVPKRPLRWPDSWRNKESSLLIISFLVIHFCNLWFNFEENIRAGWVLLLFLVVLSCTLAFLYQRRIWCRTLCPVGAFSGIMANFSFFRLKFNSTLCRKHCSSTICGPTYPENNNGCPMGINISQGIDPRFCTFCGACLKDCPHHSITVDVQIPPRVCYSALTSFPASLFVLLLLGTTLDMSLYHLTDRPIFFWQICEFFKITPSAWLELLLHGAIVAMPSLWLITIVRFIDGAANFDKRFTDWSPAALPLVILAFTALSLRPLILAGPMNLKTILFEAGYQQLSWLAGVRYLDGLPLEILQDSLIGLGLIFVGRELMRVRAGILAEPTEIRPRFNLILSAVGGSYLVLGSLFLWIFHQPMVN